MSMNVSERDHSAMFFGNDFRHRLRRMRNQGSASAKPMNHRTISLEELNNFQVDQTGQLYWKGQAVVLRQRITLGSLELLIAGIAAVATLIDAVFPIGVHFQWW